jgi:hypothetical protein
VRGALGLLANAGVILDVLCVSALDGMRGGLPGVRVLAPLSGVPGPAVLAPGDAELARTEPRRALGLAVELAEAARRAGIETARADSLVVEGDAELALRELALRARFHDVIALAAVPGKAQRTAVLALAHEASRPVLTGRLELPPPAGAPTVLVAFDGLPPAIAALRAATALGPARVVIARILTDAAPPPAVWDELEAARAYVRDVAPAALIELDTVAAREPGPALAQAAAAHGAHLLALGLGERHRALPWLLAEPNGALLVCPSGD